MVEMSKLKHLGEVHTLPAYELNVVYKVPDIYAKRTLRPPIHLMQAKTLLLASIRQVFFVFFYPTHNCVEKNTEGHYKKTFCMVCFLQWEHMGDCCHYMASITGLLSAICCTCIPPLEATNALAIEPYSNMQGQSYFKSCSLVYLMINWCVI